MQQRQRATMSAVAVVIGLLIVAVVAVQQFGGSPTGSQVTVIVTEPPATDAASATSAASAPASASAATSVAPSGGTESTSPSPTGIQLFQPGPANTTPASIPVNGRTLGDPKAPVTIDLYGDFRCSACFIFTEGGTAEAIDSQLVATGKAKLVWHDFTVIDLRDRSGASRDAANAAWCAADQNKFWTMHDWLYVNQSPTEDPAAFSTDRLLAIGSVAGMDMSTFVPCVKNGTHDADIAKEQASLPEAVAGHGTPSVLVNGQLVDASFSAVAAAVDAASTRPSVKPSPSS